jgi:spermidine/putrescine transport system substrate-binding protein
MTMHSPDRRTSRLWTPRPDRREFLRRSAMTALAVPGAAALLAACGGDDTPAASTANTAGSNGTTAAAWPQYAGIDLSRPDHPVTLPLNADPIADGLEPEPGPLKIYNYQDYINPDLIAAFEAEYGVKVEYTGFVDIDTGMDKIKSGGVEFDIFYPTTDRLAELVARDLIQPLNHSYLTNLTNVWARLQDPFYDGGSQYTVPHTIWSDGIGWRSDKTDALPTDYDNPWDILWDSANKGKVWVLQDDRDTLALPLVRMGDLDVNTDDPDKIDFALSELMKLLSDVNVKVGAESYAKVPEGKAPIHHTWSGDMLSALQYLPEGVSADLLGYWHPEDGKQIVGNDAIAIPTSAKHPVLAHLWLNYVLDVDNSLLNQSWIGYQAPITAIDPDRLVADELVPTNLESAIVREADFDIGAQLLQLEPDVEKMWDTAWGKFNAG